MGQYRTPDEEPAHDVLAADEFAMPAADPRLRHRPFVPPEDPSGIAEPHDILAAEEFAMPAGTGGAQHARGGGSAWLSSLGAAAAVVALVRLSRRRR
jgi:hypothetical protein